MEQDMYSFCRGQMAPDEFVIWTGKPETKSNLFIGQNLSTVLFAIPWTAFAVYLTVTAAQFPGLFFLSGIPFLAIGLYMLFGNFIYTAYMRKRTAYVITNKRIYRRMGRKTDNLSAAVMPTYETIMHRNGNGTIRFPLANDPYQRTYRVNGRVVTHYFSLDNLADIDRVQQAIARMDRIS